jgi:hypothetical protein
MRAPGLIQAAAVAGAAFAYAAIVERNWFALRRYDVPVLPRARSRSGCCTSPTRT